jgi:hypothetical protein
MKLHRLLLCLSVLCVLCFSCTTYDPPEYTNPIDPESPFFEKPLAQITDVNEEIPADYTFYWNGKYENSEYAYKLSPRDSSFSEWSNSNYAEYKYLDDGEYTLHVKEKYGKHEQEIATTAKYTVSEITDFSIYAYPYFSAVRIGENFWVDIKINDANELRGISLAYSFKHTLKLIDVEANNQWAIDNGFTLGFMHTSIEEANTNKLLQINCVLLGDANVAFYGEATLCRLYFSAEGAGEITPGEISVRNTENKTIYVNSERGAYVELSAQ